MPAIDASVVVDILKETILMRTVEKLGTKGVGDLQTKRFLLGER